jgi:predicted dehydrogenase
MRWGILGCGEIAEKKIAPAFMHARSARLIAVMRRNGKKASNFAKRFGAQYAYDDADALLEDPNVDAVYISAPVAMHLPLALSAARHKKHALVEKPMGMTGDEADQMVEACQSAGVKLGVAYYRRHYPKIQKIRELILTGAIGTPISAFIQFHDAVDDVVIANKPWLIQPEISGGGAGMDVGCHMADLLCYCMDAYPNSVMAIEERLVGTKAEASLGMLLHFSNGCAAAISASFAAKYKETPFLIYGTRGSITMSSVDDDRFIIKNNRGVENVVLPHAENMYISLIEDMTAAIHSGRKQIAEGADCVFASYVLDAAYASAKSGRAALISAKRRPASC